MTIDITGLKYPLAAELELPPVSTPRGSYVPVRRAGNQLIISGQGPRWDGELRYAGKIGVHLDVDAGREAAKLCALNIISHVKQACGGDLERVTGVLRVAGVVQTGQHFTEHSSVIDGASDLFFEVFGQAGRHARIATGAASLPSDMAVEIEAIFTIDPHTPEPQQLREAVS